MSGAVEFSRSVRLDTIGSTPRAMRVEANAEERLALARRFRLVSIDSLVADVTLQAEATGIKLEGRLDAAIVQSCIATAEPVPGLIAEDFALIFRPAPDGSAADEEIELDEAEMDVVFHDGGGVDVGEAVAQTLALALDPYPRAADADAKLKASLGEQEPTGPFAALASLKGKAPN